MTVTPAPPAIPPRGFQFSLATLLVAMVGCGMALAALTTPTPFWVGAAVTLALLSIPTSVLIAVYRRGAARAFAIGFVIFAGSYLPCLWFLETHPYKQGSGTDKVLPTTKTIAWLYMNTHAKFTRVVPATMTVGGMGGMGGGMFPGGYGGMPAAPPARAPYYTYGPFYEAAQYVLTLLLGLLGGIIARWLYLTAPPLDAPRATQEPRP